MPSGGAGVGQAAASSGQGGSGNGPPEFFMGDRELSVVRFLANHSDDDPNMGMSQVFTHFDGRRTIWQPAPGAYDNPEGRYEGKIPEGWEIGWRWGIYLYEIKRFNYRLPDLDSQGNLPKWAEGWEQVQLHEGLVAQVNAPGDIGERSEPANLDLIERDGRHYNPGKDDGVRYLATKRGFRLWFRGPGMGGYFPSTIRQLAGSMKDQNLGSRNVLIARKPSKPGLPIPNPDWLIQKIDEDMEASFPELRAELTDELRTDMQKWYSALPPIRQFFIGEFKWPLFEPERDTSPVPTAGSPSAGESPVPEPTALAEEPPVVSAPPPVNPTPPPPPEGSETGMRRFMEGG